MCNCFLNKIYKRCNFWKKRFEYLKNYAKCRFQETQWDYYGNLCTLSRTCSELWMGFGREIISLKLASAKRCGPRGPLRANFLKAQMTHAHLHWVPLSTCQPIRAGHWCQSPAVGKDNLASDCLSKMARGTILRSYLQKRKPTILSVRIWVLMTSEKLGIYVSS